MNRRVNVKFVVILIAALIVVGVGVAGVARWRMRIDPKVEAAKGDAAVAKGEWAVAQMHYGRALGKIPTDAALSFKLAEATRQTPVTSARDAQAAFAQMNAAYQSAAKNNPADPKPLETIYRLLLDVQQFDLLLKSADATLQRDPQSAISRKFRGIAQTMRMSSLDFSPEERERTDADLRAARDKFPDDHEAAFYLALFDARQAKYLDQPGRDPNKANALRKEARKLVTDSLALKPDEARRIHDAAIVHAELGDMQALTQLVNRLDKALRDNPDPDLLETAMRLLVATDHAKSDRPNRTLGQERAEALLTLMAKSHPNDIRLQFMEASVTMADKPDEAAKVFKRLGELPPSGVPLELGRNLEVIRASALLYSEITLNKAERTADEQERGKLIREAESVIDRVAADAGQEDPGVLASQGRIALIERKWKEAGAKLDRAIALQGTRATPSLLLKSAAARLQMGEVSAAADRFNQILAGYPDYYPARIELAKIYLRTAEWDKAQKELKTVRAAQPENEEAIGLQANLLSQQKRYPEAIKLVSTLKQGRPEVRLTLAQLYVQADQKDKALAILKASFEKNPKDPRFLQELLRLTEKKEDRLAYLDRAEKAGLAPNVAALFRAGIEQDQATILDQVRKIIDQEKDPYKKNLQLYSLYRQANDPGKAEAALAEAIKANPDGPEIIDIQFEAALREGKWDEADALATRAAKQNLDQAAGAMYYGRLELARGRFEQASANFLRAVQAVPVNSEGWRFKGDADRYRGLLVEAADAYQESLKQRANNVDALRGLATVQDMNGDTAQALDSMRRAYELAPRDPALQSQYLTYEADKGDKDRVLKIRRDLAESNPRDLNNRRTLVVLLATMKHKDQALAAVKDLLKDDPDGINSRAAAAYTHKNLGDPDTGRKLLQDFVTARGDKAVAEDWLALARYLRAINDPNASMAAYRQAVQREDPRLRPASREMADILYDRREYAAAAEIYQKIWEASPEDRGVAERYVEALLSAGKPGDAKAALDRVEGKQGESPASILLRSRILRTGGDNAGAMATLDHGTEKFPDHGGIYFERAQLLSTIGGKDDQVLADLRKAAEVDPNLTAARRVLADILLRRGQTDEALGQLTTLVARYPRDTEIRLQLVNAYLSTRNSGAARRVVDESAKLFPRESNWVRIQAQLLAMDRKPDEALAKYREAYKLEKTPQNLVELAAQLNDLKKYAETADLVRGEAEIANRTPLLRALQGRALAGVGQADAARAAFKSAVEQSANSQQLVLVANQVVMAFDRAASISFLQPLAVEARKFPIEMILANLEMDSKQFDAALSRLQALQSAVPANDPGAGLAHERALASAFEANHKFAQAADVYRRIVKGSPNDAAALNNLSYILAERLDSAKEALPLAERVGKLMPEDPQVLDTLGWVQFKAGQIERAQETLRKSFDKAKLPANAYHLAEVLLARDSRAEAMDLFRTARDLAEKAGDRETLEAAKKRLGA